MKKSIMIMTAVALVTGALLLSCTTPSQKVEKAEDKVADAKKDLDKANEEYMSDVVNYRQATADKIEANNKSIAEFNSRVTLEKKEARAEYTKKIVALEQKNTDMKKRMDDYKVEGKDKWEIFKSEFDHDMDELGKAFKDLTVNNVK